MTDYSQRFPAVPVRILALLILAAGLASARPGVLLAGGIVLAGVALGIRCDRRSSTPLAIPALLRRVRWLLLAIVILYGWFMPGTPLLPVLGPFSPTQQGLYQGLLRVAALGGIVAAVYMLLATTARGALVAGLLWFGRPLRRLGVDDRRFAVRLVLALEAVPQVQDLARAALADVAGVTRLQRIGRAAARVLRASLQRADQAQGMIDVPDPQPVPIWEWFLPAALAAVLLTVARW